LVLQLDPDDDEAEQAARMEIEARAAADIERGLSEQGRQVANELSAEPPTSRTRVVLETAILLSLLQRVIGQSAELGVGVARQQLDNVSIGFDWELSNAAAREWANRYAGELITQINSTTRRRVQAAIMTWIDSGEPLHSLIRDITPVFGRDRAELIASTEVTRAYAEANRIAYRESGVVDRVEWRTANDERVCPICGPLHGDQVGINRGFGSGISNPPAHPRCRCWIVAVIE
jgi:SPP1 gp7 family putative phage head morphogenesis protein